MTSVRRPGEFWVDGSLTLRLDGGAARRFDRPFVLVGRADGADVRITEPAVSGRHAYLQLDQRGLFVLDLASARGLRLDGAAVPAGWLAPGGVLEIADHRLEVLELVVDGSPLPASIRLPGKRPTDDNNAALARVVLQPAGGPGAAAPPWTLNSELVILGRSPACGVPIQGTTAERVHAAILRTGTSAYVVNLAGWGLTLNGRAVGPAAALADGDELTAGMSRFLVGITPVPTPEAPLPVLSAASAVAPWPVEVLPPPPPNLVPAESQTALLAWMMGAIQAVQAEAIRRQDAFQVELLQAVRGLHEHQRQALDTHQERVESIHRELAELRAEVRERYGPSNNTTSTPPTPRYPPLRITPLTTDSAAAPGDSEAATTWLLERAQRLDAENRASWRDLLGRLGPRS